MKNIPSIVQNFPQKDEILTDKGIDIELYQCDRCGLVQILQEPVYYYKDVIRAVAVSEDMREFRRDYFAEFVDSNNLYKKRIIEVGAGAGEYMQMMLENDVSVVGLEHLKESCKKAEGYGLRIYEGFIEDENYVIPNAPYDGFYIMNFLEHIPNISSFLKGIYNNLEDQGVGLIEVPNGDMILRNGLFSELMLDHLSYFTCNTLRNLLENNGFEVMSCEVIWHDYIISAIVKKRGRVDASLFSNKMNELMDRMDSFVVKNNMDGCKLAIWGAGHQALLLMTQYKYMNCFSYVIDSAPYKQNKYTPVSHKLIISPDEISDKGISAILVIGGSYSDEICRIVNEKYPDVYVEKI
ncbi:MAG: class I SAM-dependent methyltransferase [Lachnospiraceae bacterium]|nr:class I SAM-dependent methyltransferase [Lachnospiraceae bacterium]